MSPRMKSDFMQERLFLVKKKHWKCYT